ncbi:hypothetical protein TNCV_604381 [Trichonephila clavipes]|nr:hypothetical protein TNCV_604381 [Trichonephila clavipes]
MVQEVAERGLQFSQRIPATTRVVSRTSWKSPQSPVPFIIIYSCTCQEVEGHLSSRLWTMANAYPLQSRIYSIAMKPVRPICKEQLRALSYGRRVPAYIGGWILDAIIHFAVQLSK